GWSRRSNRGHDGGPYPGGCGPAESLPGTPDIGVGPATPAPRPIAAGALDECDLQPFTRPFGMGQRNHVCERTRPIQYTAGSGPPEPLTCFFRSVNTLLCRHVPDSNGLQLPGCRGDSAGADG